MTREAFIKVLERKGYSYKIEGDKIVITYKGLVDLKSLTSISPGVVFRNGAGIFLDSLASLPPGVVFENGSDIYFELLSSLSPDVVFNNEGNVWLDSLASIPPSVEFKNRGHVNLESLIGDWFYSWKGNIEGIKPNRLLNAMISLGLFER